MVLNSFPVIFHVENFIEEREVQFAILAQKYKRFVCVQCPGEFKQIIFVFLAQLSSAVQFLILMLPPCRSNEESFQGALQATLQLP